MKALAQKLLKRQAQRWLVVEYNGYRLTGMIAVQQSQELSFERTAISTEPNVENALNSVIADLRQHGTDLPERVILLTSQATATVLELPMNPTVPYKQEHLQELVQWEFDQVLQEHMASLSLETILVGRGLMTEAEVDDVRLAIGEEKATTSCITIAPKKFGTQVVKMGYADESDVDDSRKLLEQFCAPEDSPRCHFFPIEQTDQSPSTEGFPWLVCGLGQKSHQLWIQRFGSLGLHLERVYPLGFTGYASLEQTPESGRSGVIALLDGADCYTSFVNNQLQSLRWGPAPLSPRNPEALTALIGEEELESLWLSGPEHLVEGVKTVLHKTSQVPTHACPNRAPEDAPSVATRNYAEVLGAVRHQAGITPIQIPWIEGAPPPPPWWQQSTRWWGILGIVVSSLVLISEAALGFQRRSVTMATREVNVQMENAQGEIAKVHQASATADQLLASRMKLAETIAVTEQAVNLINVGLELRQTYISDLFMQLAASVKPGIAIDAFEELSDHSVRIGAWALTETEAQEFIHDFAEVTAPWGLTISHHEVQAEAGRLGLMGYDITFELSPTLNR